MSQEDVPKLTELEYFRWRFLIAEFHKAKVATKLADTEHRLMMKELENRSLLSRLFLHSTVKPAQESEKKALDTYNEFKDSLEKRLGVSLNNKVISDLTFEVRDIPEENKPE